MRKLAFAIIVALPALAQTSTTDWAVHAANEYRVIPNVTYLTASNIELKLDVYQRADAPQPTIIHTHGGFKPVERRRSTQPSASFSRKTDLDRSETLTALGSG